MVFVKEFKQRLDGPATLQVERRSSLVRRLAGLLWVLGGLLAAVPGLAAELKIGTASTAGIYYQAGRAICYLINRQSEQLGLSCQALATDGSTANIEAIAEGELQLGIVQSDVQYFAVNGLEGFSEAGPNQALRALFSLHSEPFTVVARQDAGMRTFDDLKGRRVNIGNPGSGQRATMDRLMAAKGWTKSDFQLANELSAAEQSLALCHDRVQAMVYTVGHPNASVSQATGLCDALLVEVSGPDIQSLIDKNPYYVHATIPGGIYNNNPEPVTTFGVTATLVSSTQVDADTIYAVVKTVFDHLEEFKGMHPAFGSLRPEAMVHDGLSAPLHEGAVRYYQEQGLR